MTAKKRGIDPTDTKAAILRAAKQLFVEKGFNGTSMSDIAKTSGITQSLIHHHFGSKEDIWRTVKAEYFNSYLQQMETLHQTAGVERSIKEILMTIIDQRFDFFGNQPDVIRMLLWQSLDHKGSIKGKGNKFLKQLTDVITHAQRKGELRQDIEPAFIIGTIFLLTRAWFLGDVEWVMAENNSAEENFVTTSKKYLSAMKKILEGGIFIPLAS